MTNLPPDPTVYRDSALTPPSTSDWPFAPLVRSRWRAWLRDPILILLLIFMASTVLFIGLWAYTLYEVRREALLLRLEYRAHLTDREGKDQAIQAELERIYRTLYSPPEEVPEKMPVARQPSSVELWQRNRDKELRDRINRLEQWRMRAERELAR